MVASVRGAHFRGVTIGQAAAPYNPNIFLDNFGGIAQELSLHTPDIGNDWIHYVITPTASTTGPSTSSMLSDDEPNNEQAAYVSQLTHTGTDIEFKFFVSSTGTTAQSISSVLSDSTRNVFLADMSCFYSPGGGEDPASAGTNFAFEINGVSILAYNDATFTGNAEYKIVITSTTVAFYVGGVLKNSTTMSAFTAGPTEVVAYVSHLGEMGSISVTINDGTPV